MLWGSYAQKKAAFVDTSRHLVLKARAPLASVGAQRLLRLPAFLQGQRVPRKPRPAADRLGVAGIRDRRVEARPWKRRHLGQTSALPASPEEAVLDYVPNPRGGRALSRALRRAGVHLALPGDRPARFRPSRDRLCARRDDRRKQEPQAVPRQLPQPLRLPRGRDRRHRPAADRGDEAASGCASAAIGIRAAECRSTSSGNRVRRRKACGFPIKECSPTAGGGRRWRGPKVAILGAGSVGCFIGGAWLAAGAAGHLHRPPEIVARTSTSTA